MERRLKNLTFIPRSEVINLIATTFQQLKPQLSTRIASDMQAQLPPYRKMPLPEIIKRVTMSLDAFERDLEQQTTQAYAQFWTKVAYERATQNHPIESVLMVHGISSQHILAMLKEQLQADPAAQIAMLETCQPIRESAVAAIYAAFRQHQSDIIETQDERLSELSTPIVPIHAGILVVPLVGSIDSRRATQVMEAILEQIAATSADSVIVDITGVGIIDTGVANYLLQMARAVRLLGSEIILVGIGAEVAQTLVQLGVNFQSLTTRANLQSGLEYALAQQGRVIQAISAQ